MADNQYADQPANHPAPDAAAFTTEQVEFWSGDFGRQYTDRNTRTPEEWDAFYIETWGHTKEELQASFFAHLPKDARILEVGCNTGMQLAALQRMGYHNLYGIELQPYAVEKAKQYTGGINIIQGSGFDIPFRDGFFDLVLTNGVLIHIAPADLPRIMDEMIRCTNRYIFGWEYYADDVTEIAYRGHTGFLWKADYAHLFQERCGLKEVQRKVVPYVSEGEQGKKDLMYLLERH